MAECKFLLGHICERALVKVCPQCMGSGIFVRSASLRLDPPCQMCLGKGKVPLEVCRGCGKFAFFKAGPILFCGMHTCLEKLFKERTSARRQFFYSQHSNYGGYQHYNRGGTYERNEKGDYEFRAWNDLL